MKLLFLARRAVGAALVGPFAVALAAQPTSTPNSPLQADSAGVTTVAPGVPVPAGEPCVVNLLQNVTLYEQTPGSDPTPTAYTYSPPAGCRGPWAKVVLKVDLQDSGDDPTLAYIRLAGIEMFRGSMPSYANRSNTWHVERDVTDLSSLLTQAHAGQVALIPEQTIWENMATDQAAVSAQLLFYRASSSAPAQKTPDALFGVVPGNNTISLPHNIVRAYLDVYNQEPWWYTCVTDKEGYAFYGSAFYSAAAMGAQAEFAINAPDQGCGGGSFAEIEVRIDGTPAGVAPVFPLMPRAPSTAAPNLDAPEQPSQRVNYVPYRVDLTPFAAILNEAGPHTVSLSRPADANLLVYQDKQSVRVSGAVTLNTLTGAASSPAVIDTIHQVGDTALGHISTSLDRDFTITGFVNTSQGRLETTVHQASQFKNYQVFYLDGLQFPNFRYYRQNLWLTSHTQQHSHRTRGNVVLDDDILTASYPLQLRWNASGDVDDGDGFELGPTETSVRVEQHRNLDATYLKGGFGRYTSRVRDGFVFSRTYVSGESSNWKGQAQYVFRDNRGSCYQSAVTTLNGAIATETSGACCADGQNHVRWYTHPDGSPDSLGWLH